MKKKLRTANNTKSFYHTWILFSESIDRNNKIKVSNELTLYIRTNI